MSKGEFITKIADENGITKTKATEIIDGVFRAMTVGVKKEGSFSYPGFGTFNLKKRKARMGRNPQTGEALKIAASKTVSFKPAPALKRSL